MADRFDPPPEQGRAVQLDPIKPTLEPPGSKRLKRKCDVPLSNFAFKFELRRYSKVTSTSRTCATPATSSPR